MSNNISKKIRDIRAKEGMSIEEFADFIGVESQQIVSAETSGILDIKIVEKINAVCPEHLFFLLLDSFENENKSYNSNAAFRRKWGKKNVFSLSSTALKSEEALKTEIENYMDEIERAYKTSNGCKWLAIMDAEKLTYDKLSSLINIPVSTLKKYSGNHVTPTIDVVQSLCSLFPYYMWYLMRESMDDAPDGQITPEEKKLRDLSTLEETA